MANKRQIALVTGSSRGIGAATARFLAGRGYHICLNYHSNQDAAECLIAELLQDNVDVIAVQADISVEESVIGLFKEIDQRLGAITALVNNAGILMKQARVVDMTAARINKMLSTNVTSQFLCCREAIKRMSTEYGGNGGAIVNVSSGAARLGSPGEYVDYAASKGAIDTLTKGLSLEVAKEGIRVNCVRPGSTYTDMHADGGEPDRVERIKNKIPLGRGGQADEIAAAIGWLLSSDASYVTGTCLDVTGGL